MQHFLLLVPFVYLVAISIPLATIDLREHRLPNRLTLSAATLTLGCLATSAWLGGSWSPLISALTAAGVTFLSGWLLAAREAIGMGDIKLLISLNAFAGYFSPLLPLLALAIALLAASLIGLIALFRKRLNLHSSIALGPYLLAGFFIAVTPSALAITAEVWS